MFVSPPHGEDGSQALGEQPPSLLPAVTALEMPPPRSKAAGGHTHTQPLPPRPPQLGCAGGIWAVRDPPPPSRCSFTTMGTLYPVVGPTFGGTPGRAGHTPHCCLPWSPPKQWGGGDPIAPTLHPPQLNSPHTPNPQPRSSGGLKPQRGQIWSQNGTFVRWGRRHPLFLWGERHLCAVSALAQRHLLLPRAALALFNTGVADGGTHTPSLMRQGDRP